MRRIILSLVLGVLAYSSFAQVNHWGMVVAADDTWKYIVPDATTPTTWNSIAFDDDSWSSGQGGFGFDDDDDNTTIATNAASVFIRKEFTITDLDDIVSAYLCIDYDDGFVAYINGTRIAGVGVTGTPPAYNATAVSHEAKMYSGGNPEYFKVSSDVISNNLIEGTNVLAIQVHNKNTSSSDMSAIPYLMLGIKSTATNYSTPPSWFDIVEINLETSNLPIILINTEGGVEIPYDEDIEYPKIKAFMKVINNANGINNINDTNFEYDSIIGIETRGNYSAQFDQKPYGFETRDTAGNNLNVSLLGMPAENDWIMVNNQYDKTFMRHSLAYQLSREMGYYAPRTKLCEVVVNDEYQGIYMFTEKIKQDDGRVNIAKLRDTDIAGDELTGGYIFKVDYPGENDYWTSKIDRTDRDLYTDVNFIYHYPKIDDLTNEQSTYLKDYVDQFEALLFGDNFDDFTTGYRSYVNVESFIDYFLINELAHNIDAYKKSKYYYKDKDSNGGLINSGPVWDYDWAWRNYGSSFTSGRGWAHGYYNSEYVPDLWVNRMLEDQYFKNQVYNRYNSLRETLFSKEHIEAYMDSVASHVDGAKDRHFAKWDILGVEIGYQGNLPIGETYAEEVANMKSWINRRLTFLDSEFEDFYEEGYDIIPVGSEDISAKLRLFPNPATNYIYVEGHTTINNIKLYDLSGNQISNFNSDNEYTVTLDVSSLPTGTYIIQVTTADGVTTTGKVLKN